MKKVVVLTGAGISAESGLKTFRDSDGLWEGYDIEDVATPSAWRKNPGLVLEFYNFRRAQVASAQPNDAHKALAALEKDFDVQIITQNIDDLHERAGSSKVLHLHGEIFRMCSDVDRGCVKEILGDINLGDLTETGHQYRPDIVWFGEAVPMIEPAIQLTMGAEIFVVIGTSLQVYPAAGLVEYAPRNAVKYLVDKKIRYMASSKGVIAIEKPATEGVIELVERLKTEV